jgi:ATP-binding cassette subfamily B protein
VAYIGYQGQLWNPYNYLIQLINSFNNISGVIEQVFTTLEMEEKVKDSSYATSVKLKGSIEFQDVSFSYETENALKNVSFSIKAGQKVAICGPPNSGKSTIIEMLGRLYDFAEGTIKLDNYNIKSLKQKCIHKNIGIIQQNSFIIKDTFLNNIKFGDKKVSNDECVKICKVIGAHDFIMKLGGYEKVIGDDNTILSDGERQLINLARILVKNPNIIVYDEALSSLPKDQETELIKILINKFKEKTMVFATNNQEVISACEVVIPLRNGKIVESSDKGVIEF